MRDAIIEIREGIKSGVFRNEASVSQGIVQRILLALGWPIFKPDIVSPEYALEGRRVDYALCYPPSKPAVFVEVKQIGQSDGADKQLFEYAFHLGVPLAILTDGREWHFFLPAEQGNYGERRVYMLDILEREIEECESRLIRYLSYDSICNGQAMELAKTDYKNVAKERQIHNALPSAWRKLIDDKDDFMIEAFSDKVESLCGYKPDQETVLLFMNSLVVADRLEQKPSKTVIISKNDAHQPDNTIYATDKNNLVGKNVAVPLTTHYGKQHVYKIHNAKASMIIDGGSYIVLKGSTAIKEDKGSMSPNTKQYKDELVRTGKLVSIARDLYVFKDDVPFKSPSAASAVISGTSTNGKLCFNI